MTDRDMEWFAIMVLAILFEVCAMYCLDFYWSALWAMMSRML